VLVVAVVLLVGFMIFLAATIAAILFHPHR
jgi:hypothetical protein